MIAINQDLAKKLISSDRNDEEEGQRLQTQSTLYRFDSFASEVLLKLNVMLTLFFATSQKQQHLSMSTSLWIFL